MENSSELPPQRRLRHVHARGCVLLSSIELPPQVLHRHPAARPPSGIAAAAAAAASVAAGASATATLTPPVFLFLLLGRLLEKMRAFWPEEMDLGYRETEKQLRHAVCKVGVLVKKHAPLMSSPCTWTRLPEGTWTGLLGMLGKIQEQNKRTFWRQ